MQTTPALAIEWVVVLFIAALALIVLVKIWMNKIDLSGLLNEPPDAAAAGAPAGGGAPTPPAVGKASLSRLQLLLFTFVIAGLYLTLCLEAGEMIEMPNQVLGLLGISSGSYVVSKGIQANK